MEYSLYEIPLFILMGAIGKLKLSCCMFNNGVIKNSVTDFSPHSFIRWSSGSDVQCPQLLADNFQNQVKFQVKVWQDGDVRMRSGVQL